ncbi:hypothetical protein [Microbacterium sp. JB110]|uniref:hypothetical protein n=1 Tax=Microbacterium sp. JB110 TaxID=2024477 RepID=UPI00097F4DED|nr:hypothetical protein [Microbacterium sp. JB110]RCS57674.1 hypothetical protein CIK77_15755 [Microbacterium sp. JB110]SJM45938.1 Endoglucanase [Frigoribacterium sp. JB110]
MTTTEPSASGAAPSSALPAGAPQPLAPPLHAPAAGAAAAKLPAAQSVRTGAATAGQGIRSAVGVFAGAVAVALVANLAVDAVGAYHNPDFEPTASEVDPSDSMSAAPGEYGTASAKDNFLLNFADGIKHAPEQEAGGGSGSIVPGVNSEKGQGGNADGSSGDDDAPGSDGSSSDDGASGSGGSGTGSGGSGSSGSGGSGSGGSGTSGGNGGGGGNGGSGDGGNGDGSSGGGSGDGGSGDGSSGNGGGGSGDSDGSGDGSDGSGDGGGDSDGNGGSDGGDDTPIQPDPPTKPDPPVVVPDPLKFGGLQENSTIKVVLGIKIKVLSSYTLTVAGEPGSAAKVTYGGNQAGTIHFDGSGTGSLKVGGRLLDLGISNPTITVAYSDGTKGSSISRKLKDF